MTTPLRIAVLGSINMDLVIRCQTLPQPGQTLLAQSSAEVCGGKGANQAVAAARAGGTVSMIGRVGDDTFAQRLIDNLEQAGIDGAHVRRTPQTSSGLAVVAVEDSGQNAILVVPGANGAVTVDDVLAARSVIESSDVLLLQLEIPVEPVAAAVGIARQAGVRVILDPAPAVTELPAALYDVDLLCPNESEAAILTGRPATTDSEALLAAERLQQRGTRHVAVTLGDRGTAVRSGRSSELVPAFPVTAVDTTAAGDAFAGALAVRWAETDDLVEAIRFANAAGALAASRPGAQPGMARRDEIEQLGRTRT